MFKVSRAIKNKISKTITSLIDSIKRKLLGKGAGSLRDLYLDSAREEGSFYPDMSSLETLSDATANYLDGFKVKTINSVLNEVESSTDLPKTVYENLTKAKSHLETIVTTQTQSVKNMGALNGIFNIAILKGVDDPVIYWAGPNDNITCDVCLTLYFLPDGRPRVWKVSELKTSFFNKKHDHAPSVHSAHPNCRHTPSLVLPGYGFNPKSNILVWIKEGYSEFDNQRKP